MFLDVLFRIGLRNKSNFQMELVEHFVYIHKNSTHNIKQYKM